MGLRLRSWANTLLRNRKFPPVPLAARESLPTEISVEEETLPYYEPDQYYSVHVGDTFYDRYRVSGKLGFGAYSTTWLCRDLRGAGPQYTAVKVSTSLKNYPTATFREMKVYEHLGGVKSDHPGQSLIRELYDTFELDGHSAKHQCLVQQPMHMSLLEMMGMNSKPFNLPLLKMTLRRLLLALDFLHTEAGVVHTDLKTDNMMLDIQDKAILSDFEKAEATSPSPFKLIGSSHAVYRSRRFRRPKRGFGLPILCDFGEARIGKLQETGPLVQPHIYRAPEVIFEMPWGPAVDIWNLAGLTWDLFEGEHLFEDIFDSAGCHDPFKHLALMAALLGMPPPEFVKRSETTDQCFDSEGNWVANEHASIPSVSLEDLEKRLSGYEKAEFIRFMRSMLRWLPEERKSAKQLLEDPWLSE